MIKTLAKRAVVTVPPVRRLLDDRARWRSRTKEARAEAAEYKREAARLREKLGIPEPTDEAVARLATTLDPQLSAFDRLNFGCGYDKRDGFLNVDSDVACAPDLLVIANDLSAIPRGHYREVLANDVLEHISHRFTLSVLLDLADFLHDGGKLHVSTSSILGVAERLTNSGTYADDLGWTICLFGNQVHAGDFHHVGFTEATLRTNLVAAGFEVDSFQLDDAWLFRVDCHKVYDWTQVLSRTTAVPDDEFIRAIYAEAFDREPDEHGHASLARALKRRKMTRKDALKSLMQSRERLYVTAQKHGL